MVVDFVIVNFYLFYVYEYKDCINIIGIVLKVK